MHGHSPGFALLVNAEVDSMGGVVDSGVGLDMETSPRHTEIEKAQAELRQEYDVREERRRELEFLEKGGNPLDFKVIHAASFSRQSTSLTDQLAEQYVISEAKGSFALAASPHGDSVESSGRPAGSMGRESNTADNLLLFDGENNHLDREGNVKRPGKSKIDGSNVKEIDESVIFRLGVKNQAYARRNRSRSSRDGARGSTDLIQGHSSRTSILPSSLPDSRDVKGSLWEARVQERTVSSISNSKAASPNDNVDSKACASGDQLDIELSAVQTHYMSIGAIKDGQPRGTREANASENSRENDYNNQHGQVIAEQIPNGTTSPTGDIVGKEESASVGVVSAPGESTENIEDFKSNERIKGFSVPDKSVVDLNEENQGRKITADDSITGLFSMDNNNIDASCANVGSSIDGNADDDHVLVTRRGDGCSNGGLNGQSVSEGNHLKSDNKDLRGKSELLTADAQVNGKDEPRSLNSNLNNLDVQIKFEAELCESRTDMQSEVRSFTDVDCGGQNGGTISEPGRQPDNSSADGLNACKKGCTTGSLASPNCETSNPMASTRCLVTTSELQNSTASHLKLAKKAREDAILKEARMIEANRRRAAAVSMSHTSLEKRKKCHWDFVLEEMAWMANDFMQERAWKIYAAAQVCRQIASTSCLKLKQENMCRRQKVLARTLAKAVIHFWQSAKVPQKSCQTPVGMHEGCDLDLPKRMEINGVEADSDQGTGPENSGQGSIEDYALRFLKYNNISSINPVLAEAPTTPDRIYDAGILEMSWEDQLLEENLFYTVLPGSMQAYRESVESQLVHYKKSDNTLNQEDREASICDSVADREIAYEEDEGETDTYVLHGAFEGNLSLKFNRKKKKILQRNSYGGRLYEVGTDLTYEPCIENKSGSQALMYPGKRPSSTLNVGSIPTKRVRTAARQRPLSIGLTGSLQLTSKTDVSSGDTSSLQDDQSSLHGGSQSRQNLDVESTMDFERPLQFDGCEVSTKSKKKKKPRHLGFKNSLNLVDSDVVVVSGKLHGSSYEQRLQAESMVQHQQQRDPLKKRLESLHFESNGGTGIYGQHAAKKPKLLKQLPDTSEAITPITGSMPSPVASQMSNMSNSNKLIKLIASRDRGRKSKSIKIAAGQSGPGSAWSLFEDQALVVLVHDMGLNWELVSDAINSTLQFKCIFRKPKECMERHKFLMDKSAADGADSAEDSGSSQPYPSTLPGIPRGSARQLFQRLQGPLEEDALKAHFEKIILLGQQLNLCRSQNDSQELKQIAPPHSSHLFALSQVLPNNVTGSYLTPLDLCDAIASSPDVLSLGYQGSHASGQAIPGHQGSVAPIPTSSTNAILQASPGMVLGTSLPSPSTPLSASSRDAQRYSVPRQNSLPVDDQHRMQQYNHMLSGRSSMSVPGALPMGVDRGARMLPGGNGMGMMCGMNRGMPMPRPGFQGIGSPGMLNVVSSGSMLSASGIGMPNAVNVHPGAVSGPGNPMLRPREAMQMLRPGQNTEDHRQMMMQELQLQASQGNGQAVAPFNSMSAPFPNATVSPVQTFPVQQHQQSHQMLQQQHMLGNPHHPHIQGTNHSSPQQQAYAFRLAKERQLQQRMMPQSQHPFSGPNVVSPMPNGSQIQQQSHSSSTISPIPSSQSQNKQQNMPRNQQTSCGMPNQIMKKQRPQTQQQQAKNHQQPRQQSQQQAKLMKGLGRGAMLIHQNLSVDASHVGSLPTAAKNQVPEKHLMQQGQGFYPGSPGLNPSLHQPSNQQKMFTRPPPQSSKQLPSMPSHSDTGPVQVPSNHTLLATPQPSVPSLPPLAAQQQQRQTNHAQQTMQRILLQQNRPVNPDGRIQSSTEQPKVSPIIPTTSVPQCTDSVTSAPVISPAQWKPEPSYDTSTPTPTAHLASSPDDNLAGSETLNPPSSQALAQRQFSGTIAMHGNGTGGQWQQQQPNQQQQHPQHQHRQAPQGNLYVLPSNSGPG